MNTVGRTGKTGGGRWNPDRHRLRCVRQAQIGQRGFTAFASTTIH
jgi:hypothetical protein